MGLTTPLEGVAFSSEIILPPELELLKLEASEDDVFIVLGWLDITSKNSIVAHCIVIFQ